MEQDVSQAMFALQVWSRVVVRFVVPQAVMGHRHSIAYVAMELVSVAEPRSAVEVVVVVVVGEWLSEDEDTAEILFIIYA
jgi:hypothetical protein